MNNCVKLIGIVLLTALFCGGIRAASAVNPAQPTVPVDTKVNTKSTGYTAVLSDVPNITLDTLIGTLFVFNGTQILFNRHASAQNYAWTILSAGAAVLRRDSMAKTGTYLATASGWGSGKYYTHLINNPTNTLAGTAVALAGAYLVGSYVSNWWKNFSIKTYLYGGWKMGN